MSKSKQTVDWKRINETWYVAGFNATHLDESLFSLGGNLSWSADDMDRMFLNRAIIEAEYPFPIRWTQFDEKYGGVVFRLGRSQLLCAVLVYSLLEQAIRSTYDIYRDILERLGVELADYGDDWSSVLPDFYYDPKMSSEDFFFEHFLPAKLGYAVHAPDKFAAWVEKDERWHRISSLCPV